MRERCRGRVCERRLRNGHAVRQGRRRTAMPAPFPHGLAGEDLGESGRCSMSAQAADCPATRARALRRQEGAMLVVR